MTTAPQALLAARTLMLTHLDMHPGRTVDADLDPAEAGIVGDTSHVREGDSYHLGRPEQAWTGYAATESPRDKAGLDDKAAATDWGWFVAAVAGKRHDLRSFSVWLVAQCKAGTADTRDIREVIYSPDGMVVKRWDRLGRRSTGDSSHRSHTHVSYFRDAIKAGRDQSPVYRRYLTEIGLIKAPTQEIDMEQADKLVRDTGFSGRTVGDVLADLQNLRNTLLGVPEAKPAPAGSPLAGLLAMAANPPGTVTITDEQLERVLRKVIGSVDGASPAS